MKHILSFFLLFISTLSVAQINYQALIKDSNGNVLTNNQVKFKFTLMENSSTSSPVYVEEHTVITPQSGVVNLSIGAGDVSSGSFSAIDWSNEVYIKEELDIGSGYEDMGTKQIASVPVAEYAKSSGSSISSLTFVDSSNNLSIGTSVSLDGERNVAIGVLALDDENSNAKYNVGIGYGALSNIASGTGNVAIGDGSLPYLERGFNNIALGAEALFYNKSDNNIAIGGAAMSNNTSGTANISVGTRSLYNNTDGSNSIAIGYNALYGNNGYGENIAIGTDAMYSSSNISSNTGSWNIAIGRESLRENSKGQSNIAIGVNALEQNEGTSDHTEGEFTWNEGSFNIAIGNKALSSNVSGSFNIAIGDSAGQNISGSINNTTIGNYSLAQNTSGRDNTAIGAQALSSQTDNVFGNVGIGSHALYNNDIGGANVAVGTYSLGDATYVYNTVAIGDFSGRFLDTDGSANNTFIGKQTGTVSGLELHNSTVIGSDAIVSSNHTMVFGDNDVEKWAFGLSTTDVGKAIQVGDDTTNGNGAYLTTGGTWTNGSSILFKNNFIDLTNEWILDKISQLNIRKWDYKNTNETHIGPTSEEFVELFDVGIPNENSHLSTIDVSGVALKGIQALIEENEEQKKQIEVQRELINALYERLIKIEQIINE